MYETPHKTSTSGEQFLLKIQSTICESLGVFFLSFFRNAFFLKLRISESAILVQIVEWVNNSSMLANCSLRPDIRAIVLQEKVTTKMFFPKTSKLDKQIPHFLQFFRCCIPFYMFEHVV